MLVGKEWLLVGGGGKYFTSEVGGAGGDEDRDEDNDVGELPDELMSDVRGGTGRLFLAFLSISSFISK